MDTFDTITACAFLLVTLPLVARLTFWKRQGERLPPEQNLTNLLLWALAVLNLSAVHHWNAPHRRTYQFALIISAAVVSAGKLAASLYTMRQEAIRKKQMRGDSSITMR